MTLVERLAGELVESGLPMDRASLRAAAEEMAMETAPASAATVTDAVLDLLVGLGPVQRLLRLPGVSDVLVNGPNSVWVEKHGLLQETEVVFPSDDAVVAAVERVISPLGLRIDRASPVVDARLPDGSRLHAVLPPIAVDHPVFAVRRFIPEFNSLKALVGAGMLGQTLAQRIRAAVEARRNIVVSGGTGSGKTTLLNALSGEIEASQRIVCIEDASELQLAGHVVRLESRPPNAEGRGAVPLASLVRAALRLRPDRIVVGEVRGPEAMDLVNALNTGHAGSMSTVHANSPQEALWRLETLAMLGAPTVSVDAIRGQLHSAIDLVIHIERRGPNRRVASVAEVNVGSLAEWDL